MATSTTAQELLQLERKFWGALKDRDVDTALRLTDFPCIITGAQGVGSVEKQAFAAMIENARYTIENVELRDDAQVRMLNDDVAVLGYQVHEDLVVDGQPLSLDAADSSTWVRRNGRWRCALHSEAIAGDPFGRDRTPVDGGGAAPQALRGGAASEPRPMRAGDERAIREVIAAWLEAARAGDVSAQLPMIADDVVFMAPGQEPFGKDAFARSARAMADVRLDAKSEVNEVVVVSDWAWSRTHLNVTIALPNAAAMHRSGYTLTIWRKQPDGKWVLARDANLLTPQ